MRTWQRCQEQRLWLSQKGKDEGEGEGERSITATRYPHKRQMDDIYCHGQLWATMYLAASLPACRIVGGASDRPAAAQIGRTTEFRKL
ncbi:hypothetical protein E4U52_002337, partial [Claviceps spartinae]